MTYALHGLLWTEYALSPSSGFRFPLLHFPRLDLRDVNRAASKVVHVSRIGCLSYMNSSDQQFNTPSSLPPVLAGTPSVVDESLQPDVTPDDLSEANPPKPDEEKELRQQDGVSGEDRMPLGDRELCQPAIRIETPAVATPSTETTDGFFRLRPWQAACREALAGSRNWIINAATAAGT